MTRGILWLAFGAEFDKLGDAAATYSRRFTDLPMHVITNLTSPRPWPNGTTFTYLDMPSEQNRAVKVSLVDYTPFAETLFIDCDAVIQRPGIERYFEDLQRHDLACQFRRKLRDANHHIKLQFYREHYLSPMAKLGEPYPLVILQSSAFLFRRSAELFFRTWRELWELGGKRRDMLGFSLAGRLLGVRLKVYRPIGDGFLANEKNAKRAIQHKAYKGFLRDFGLPNYNDWNP